MRAFQLSLLLLLPAFLPHGAAEENDLSRGAEIMAEVRAQLPLHPLRLTGFIRTRDGRRNIDRELVTEFRLGDPLPHMTFHLADRFGEPLTHARITWHDGQPRFQQWDPEGNPIPNASLWDDIAETGLNWSDLSLDFLWWGGAERIGRERVKTRSSHVVRIPAPPERKDLSEVILWIDTSEHLIVRAQLLDPDGEPLKRIDVDSIVEYEEGMWMAKDLIIRDQAEGRRMGVRFEDVTELDD